MVLWVRNLDLVFELVVVEARGSVLVRIPARGQPREGPLCSLALDGGFCGRMRHRALQKICKDSAVEASGGGGTVMLPCVGPRGCQAIGTLGLTRTPDVAYQVSPNLGIFQPLWRKDPGQPCYRACFFTSGRQRRSEAQNLLSDAWVHRSIPRALTERAF